MHSKWEYGIQEESYGHCSSSREGNRLVLFMSFNLDLIILPAKLIKGLGFSLSMPKQLISILKKKTEKERLSYYWLLIRAEAWNVARRTLKCLEMWPSVQLWNAIISVMRLFWFYYVVGLAFVDCSASSETIRMLNQVVDMGCCVVLANKKPLTSTMVINL